MCNFDLTTKEKREEIRLSLKQFNSKKEVFDAYGMKNCGSSWRKIDKVLDAVGLGADFYAKKKERPTAYCLNCGKELTRYNQKMFCSQSCAATYNNKCRIRKPETNQKISCSLMKHHEECDHVKMHGKVRKRITAMKNRICPICGAERPINECQNKQICHRTRQFYENTMTCFGFDASSIGSNRIISEFEKVVSLLTHEYIDNKLSVAEIKEKYDYPMAVETLTSVMRVMGIPFRCQSERSRNALIRGRATLHQSHKFKSGVYTNKQGYRHYYRSSYELIYCQYLDEHNIDYRYESLRITYYDSERQTYRVAVPDFFIPSTSTIVEVKSRVTLRKQCMIDKFLAYKDAGYTPIIRLENQDYTLDELYLIKENDYILGMYAH